jgi:hypothetical protein
MHGRKTLSLQRGLLLACSSVILVVAVSGLLFYLQVIRLQEAENRVGDIGAVFANREVIGSVQAVVQSDVGVFSRGIPSDEVTAEGISRKYWTNFYFISNESWRSDDELNEAVNEVEADFERLGVNLSVDLNSFLDPGDPLIRRIRVDFRMER